MIIIINMPSLCKTAAVTSFIKFPISIQEKCDIALSCLGESNGIAVPSVNMFHRAPCQRLHGETAHNSSGHHELRHSSHEAKRQ